MKSASHWPNAENKMCVSTHFQVWVIRDWENCRVKLKLFSYVCQFALCLFLHKTSGMTVNRITSSVLKVSLSFCLFRPDEIMQQETSPLCAADISPDLRKCFAFLSGETDPTAAPSCSLSLCKHFYSITASLVMLKMSLSVRGKWSWINGGKRKCKAGWAANTDYCVLLTLLHAWSVYITAHIRLKTLHINMSPEEGNLSS